MVINQLIKQKVSKMIGPNRKKGGFAKTDEKGGSIKG